jgi:asparagine synthase (glutamine-hydrolysing)
MCGIFGWYGNELFNSETALIFLNALKHRGPDSSGFCVINNETSFGMVRLAINDLSDSGNQPFTRGNLNLVFNGELYNFKKVREELLEQGSTFKGSSDAEVFLAAYEFWGLHFIEKMEGMFAFGIWDSNLKELLLGRDRSGEKPLYYYQEKNEIFFSSEIRPLQYLFKSSLNENKTFLSQYLTFGYSPNGATPFQNIKQVEPGCILIAGENGSLVHRYWSPNFRNVGEISYPEAKKRISQLLNESITQQLESSDVPIGILVSSGIDSGLIASKALKIKKDLHLFTLAFENKTHDESKSVREKFRKLTPNHHVHTLRYSEELIFKALNALDTPLADSSVIPMYTICEFASSFVKASLTGDGADELFAGYSTYLASKMARILKNKKIPQAFFEHSSMLIPVKHGNVNISYKLKTFLDIYSQHSQNPHLYWRQYFNKNEILQLIGNTNYQEMEDCFSNLFLNDNLYQDFLTWMPNDILRKSDLMSMRHSLELRAPYLSKNLMEYTFGLPEEYKVLKFNTKRILKDVYKEEVGNLSLISRKRGFGSPVSEWFKLDPLPYLNYISDEGTFNPIYVKMLFNDHIRKNQDNGYKIFALLSYAVWNRKSK